MSCNIKDYKFINNILTDKCLTKKVTIVFTTTATFKIDKALSSILITFNI